MSKRFQCCLAFAMLFLFASADVALSSEPTDQLSPTAVVDRGRDDTQIQRLESKLREHRRKNRYQPFVADALKQIEALFLRTLQEPSNVSELEHAWREAGWSFSLISQNGDPIFVIHPMRKRGGGMYAIRTNAQQSLVLQAPHSFADRGTRSIARQLFERNGVFAAAWNTTHRKYVDLAHKRSHPYNCFLRAVAAARPDALFVQLHGFAQEKRKTPPGMSADLIVSDGTRAPQSWTRNAAKIFQRDLVGATTRLYPYEVRELGALTNAQSLTLRLLANRRFLHLEMSGPLRTRMQFDQPLQSDFLKQLFEIYRLSLR